MPQVAGLGPRSDQLADSVIPCSHLASIQRASLKEQISWRCGKCRAVIVRRAGSPCMRMTLTLSVCHAWGNPMLTPPSGTDCSHCKSFSLASLRARIAFFSENDFQRGLGSVVRGQTDLRPMVRRGVGPAHQLSRNASSVSGLSILPAGHSKTPHANMLRQPIRGVIHKSPWQPRLEATARWRTTFLCGLRTICAH